MHGKLSKKNLSSTIYEEYLERIRQGLVTHDVRLVDTAIAAEKGMSRMPVRDGLMRLVHEGYLEQSTRGFMLPDLSREEVLEIFEIRRLLEPRAAALAAMNLTDAALKRMEAAVAQTAAAAEAADISRFYRECEVYRSAWLQAVQNRALYNTILRLVTQVQAVRLATMRDADARLTVVTGQREILAAFKARNPVAAQDAQLRYVLAGEACYLGVAQ